MISRRAPMFVKHTTLKPCVGWYGFSVSSLDMAARRQDFPDFSRPRTRTFFPEDDEYVSESSVLSLGCLAHSVCSPVPLFLESGKMKRGFGAYH